MCQPAGRLTDLEVATPTGKPRWNVTSMRGILRNRTYDSRTAAPSFRAVVEAGQLRLARWGQELTRGQATQGRFLDRPDLRVDGGADIQSS